MAVIATLHRLSAPGTVFGPCTAEDVEREFIRATSGSGLIRDVTATGRGGCVSPHLPCGVKFQGAASDFEVRKALMRGFRMAANGKYCNGDGFSSELGNARLFFNTCIAEDNSDGGFDLKGPDWRTHNCRAKGNSKGFRFWSSGHATGKLISEHPRQQPGSSNAVAHVHVCPAREHAEQQVIVIDFLYARGAGALLLVETVAGAIPPRIIIIKGYDIKGVTAILRVIGANPEIDWGPQGNPVLKP